MATKPFYSLQETQEKLGVGEDAIRQFVSNGQLREFRSQGQLHFKSDEVDKLALEVGLGSVGPAEGLDDNVIGTATADDFNNAGLVSAGSEPPSFGSNMGSADIGLSESVGFANPDDLGLSESVGFSMPADEEGRSQPVAGMSSEVPNTGSISGSQTGLGSADLGLSESVGFSAGLGKSDSDSSSDSGSKGPLNRAQPDPIPQQPSVGGDLGLSESVGFSQLDESDENVARGGTMVPPRATDLDDPESASFIPPVSTKKPAPNRSNLPSASSLTLQQSDALSLDLADEIAPPIPRGGGRRAKDDTVITSAGISVFDDEDLEVGAADPLAKTAVAPTVDEQQLSLEGVGSGSGLLDLTREADDTSLDAELLDEIYPTSAGGMSITNVESAVGPAASMADSRMGSMPSSGFGPAMTGVGGGVGSQYAVGAPQIITQYVEEVEAPDPFAPAFSLPMVAATILLGMVGIMYSGLAAGVRPAFAEFFGQNLLILTIVMIVVMVVLALVGFLMGRKTRNDMLLAERQRYAMAGDDA